MQKMSILGNLGLGDSKDQERFVLKKTSTGKPYVAFSVAVNKGKGDDETTQWWQCVAFDRCAEIVASYGAKGRKIFVEGEPRMYPRELDAEGNNFVQGVSEGAPVPSEGFSVNARYVEFGDARPEKLVVHEDLKQQVARLVSELVKS